MLALGPATSARPWVRPDRSRYRHVPYSINTDLLQTPTETNYPTLIQDILAFARDLASKPHQHPEVRRTLLKRGFKQHEVKFLRSEGLELFVRGLMQLACWLDISTWTFRMGRNGRPPSLKNLAKALRRGSEKRMPKATVDRVLALFHGAGLIWSRQPRELVDHDDGQGYHFEGHVALRGPQPHFFRLTGTHAEYLRERRKQNKEESEARAAAKRAEKRERLEKQRERLREQWQRLETDERAAMAARFEAPAYLSLPYKIRDRFGAAAADAFVAFEKELAAENPTWSRWHVRLAALRKWKADQRTHGPPG